MCGLWMTRASWASQPRSAPLCTVAGIKWPMSGFALFFACLPCSLIKAPHMFQSISPPALHQWTELLGLCSHRQNIITVTHRSLLGNLGTSLCSERQGQSEDAKVMSELILHSHNNPSQFLTKPCSHRDGVISVTLQPLLCRVWLRFPTVVIPCSCLLYMPAQWYLYWLSSQSFLHSSQHKSQDGIPYRQRKSYAES